MLIINTFPHPDLFKVCEPVTDFDLALRVTLDLMWKTMKNANGLGLAANQCGFTKRMFVMEGVAGERLYVVNPAIRWRSSAKAQVREGCLSAPKEFLYVPDRSDLVIVDFVDEKNRPQTRKLQGTFAVAIQHEINHLDGKSFMEDPSIPKSKRRDLAKKWGLKI
jgi:peptide deformylase